MTKKNYLDFNLVEGLAVINAHNGSGHLRDNDHVSQMSLDHIGFLIDRALLLLLAELLDQSHRLALKATADLPPDTAREQFHKLFIVHVKELVQVNTAVGELAESPLFLELSGSLNRNGKD